jgi:phosphatidylglycerophosphatase A
MRAFVVHWIQKIIASVFFIGYIPFASGTFASAGVVAALWFFRDKVSFIFRPESVSMLWMCLLGLTALSIVVSHNSRANFGTPDPRQVVIDEVVGQLFTFFLVPFSLPTLITGFVLFRFFDIVKPYPIHLFESLDEGVGITMDDVVGGIMAGVSLNIVLWIYHAIHAFLT